MKRAIFWIAAVCNPVEVCRRFGDALSGRRPAVEAAGTTETSANFTRLHGATT